MALLISPKGKNQIGSLVFVKKLNTIKLLFFIEFPLFLPFGKVRAGF